MSFEAFEKTTSNRFRFHLFLFYKLPAAWLAGVRLVSLNRQQAVTSVPYKWLSQNPFKSIYFACQAMAAELSTGVLAMGYTYNSHPRISMLVTNIEASFTKKATGRILFSCDDGDKIDAAVNSAKQSGEGVVVVCRSVGTNTKGETVSEFLITWSFKASQRS